MPHDMLKIRHPQHAKRPASTSSLHNGGSQMDGSSNDIPTAHKSKPPQRGSTHPVQGPRPILTNMTVPSQPEPNTRDLRPLRTTQKSSNLRKTPRTRTPHDDDPNHAGPLGTEGSTETRVHAAPTTEGRNTEQDSTMMMMMIKFKMRTESSSG